MTTPIAFDFDRIRNAARNCPQAAPWFELVDDLARTSIGIMRALQVSNDDKQRLCIATLFIRAKGSLQSAILLVERGMISDARVVLRSATEAVIASIAAQADPNFIDELIGAHRKTQLTLVGVIDGDAEYQSTLSQEDIAVIRQTVEEIESLEAANGKQFRLINWADTALKYCAVLYNLVYRDLSSDGTHVSVTALNRHVEADANMNIVSLKAGPDLADLTNALSVICLISIWAMYPLSGAFGLAQVEAKISDSRRRYKELSASTGR